jgi:hypothetical protein
MDLPVVGISYEVSKGRFWWKDRGSQPYSSDEALQMARTFFSKAPIMVPIYSHCCIPCSPNLARNPIFFMYKNIFIIVTTMWRISLSGKPSCHKAKGKCLSFNFFPTFLAILKPLHCCYFVFKIDRFCVIKRTFSTVIFGQANWKEVNLISTQN